MARVAQKPGPGRAPLVAAIKTLDGERGKVGWFESAKYEDGTPVAYVATIQEYGYAGGNIPPRPYFRPTVEGKRNEWRQAGERASRALVRGAMSGSVMELLASKAAGDARKAISQVYSPALKPTTLYARQRRRNSSVKPLVDSGTMLATLTHTVERTK